MMQRNPVALDTRDVSPETGSTYPAKFAALVSGRTRRRLGNVFGLTQFGVNLVELAPGAASSQRHWHSREDEFVLIVDGTLTLVTDEGETELHSGMMAGFPAGVANGHHLVNRSDRPATYFEVGSRVAGDEGDYPDIDMRVVWADGRRRFVHKDGTPY